MNRFEINRRGFLRGAVAAGAFVAAGRPVVGASHSRVEIARALGMPRPSLVAAEARQFAPVKIARNRIIRTVVGLRPFREEGFVVDAERLGDKLLVHNYGHGGAGVTLSWGTSSQAVDIAKDFLTTKAGRGVHRSSPRFAVLGSGVMGLSTARLLQRRLQGQGGGVTIYAKAIPPQTTSNIAGALWLPTSAYDSEVATPKFLEQFRRAAHLSNRAFQELVGPEYGVRWIDSYDLILREASLSYELAGGSDLYPQVEDHRDPERYFGFNYARQYSTMLIEPHTYLRALMRDFYSAGGKIVIREFGDREEIARLTESIVFNCTGLGARDLFGDQKLGPVRGQLEVLLPQPEIDYCYLSGSSYMFPRRDGIILGGTFNHGDWSLEPKAAHTAEILEGHANIMKGLKRV